MLQNPPDQLELALKDAEKLASTDKFDEASAICRNVLGVDPNNGQAIHLLGFIALRRGDHSSAIDLLSKSVRLQPGNVTSQLRLADVFLKLHRWSDAAEVLNKLLLQRPDFLTASTMLGMALFHLGRLQDAQAAFAHTELHGAGNAIAQSDLARALLLCKLYDPALVAAEKAIALRPDWHVPYLHRGNALKGCGRVSEAVIAFRKAASINPNLMPAWSALLFSVYFDPSANPQSIYHDHSVWNERLALPLQKQSPSHSNSRDPNRRIRIGYFSPHFGDHCQSFFTIPLFSNHDHKQFEIHCYSDLARPSDTTATLRSYADQWHDCWTYSDAALAARIAEDDIDILVDLAMHMGGGRPLLFARKPAPVQIAWLAYPGTTGLTAMDYRLTDPYLDPPGLNDAFYSEKSIRFPDTFWCYAPTSHDPQVNSLPRDSNGYISFGCLNNFCKINDDVLAMWSQVLDQVPNSRLILLAPEGNARPYVLDRLNIDPARLEFVDRQLWPAYMATYHRIDIGLDTFPYNGHTTSLDAMWMGVPVVSRYGEAAVSRAGLSQSSNMGLTDLVTDDRSRFVDIAVALTTDLPRLRELRATLRQRLLNSPLMNASHFTRNIEQVYRDAWRHWCASQK